MEYHLVAALSELNDPLPVLRAIEEHDRLGEEAFLAKYGYGPARSYWLLHDGRRYASKAILGVAFGYRSPGARPLKASEFAGGESTVRRALTRLGFTVEVDDNAAVAAVLPVLASGDADTTAFDPEGTVDAREKILREIRARRGQKAFRDHLLEAYGARCSISGCSTLDVLEAAHILPYRGEATNHPTNGLLLRADLHTLFDCGLLAIDPDTLQVLVSASIMEPTYREMHGRKLREVSDARLAPSRVALRRHRAGSRV